MLKCESMSLEIIKLITQPISPEDEADTAVALGSHKKLLEDAWSSLNASFDARGDIHMQMDLENHYSQQFLKYWRGKFRFFMNIAGVTSEENLAAVLNKPLKAGDEKVVFSASPASSSGEFVMKRESLDGKDKVALWMSESQNYGTIAQIRITSDIGEPFPKTHYTYPMEYALQINNGRFYHFIREENFYQGGEIYPHSSRSTSLSFRQADLLRF